MSENNYVESKPHYVQPGLECASKETSMIISLIETMEKTIAQQRDWLLDALVDLQKANQELQKIKERKY